MAGNISYIEPVALDGTLALIVPIVNANGELAAQTGTPAYSIYELNGDNVGTVMSGGTGTLSALPTPVTGLLLLTHSISAANQYRSGGNYQISGTYVQGIYTRPFNYVFSVT